MRVIRTPLHIARKSDTDDPTLANGWNVQLKMFIVIIIVY